MFYASALGSLVGTVAGWLLGSRAGNVGLQAAGDPIWFGLAVMVAAVGVAIVVITGWEAAIAALTRRPKATFRDSLAKVGLVASAVAALLFMLVAQPLAVPVALLTFLYPVLWLAGALLWLGFKRKVLGR